MSAAFNFSKQFNEDCSTTGFTAHIRLFALGATTSASEPVSTDARLDTDAQVVGTMHDQRHIESAWESQTPPEGGFSHLQATGSRRSPRSSQTTHTERPR